MQNLFKVDVQVSGFGIQYAFGEVIGDRKDVV